MPRLEELKKGTRIIITDNCCQCGVPTNQTGWKGMCAGGGNLVHFDNGERWFHCCNVKVINEGFDPEEIISSIFKNEGE